MADAQAVSLCEHDLDALRHRALESRAAGNHTNDLKTETVLELIRLARMGLKFEGTIDTLTGRLLIVKQKIDAELEDLKAVFGEGGER
jgi:argininosuccinate synthase